jgi:hypothetical protein
MFEGRGSARRDLYATVVSGRATDYGASVRRVAVSLGLALATWASRAEAAIPPSVGGHLIVSTASTSDDPRLGQIAAAFARRGVESFVAYDMVKPPPDAERLLVRGRWALDEARRLRRREKLDAAARNGDAAIKLFEKAASEETHLTLLVEALIERGAIAVKKGDQAFAETVFFKANALDPEIEPDAALFPEDAVQLFQEVRRVSRQLNYGALRIDPTGIESPVVRIDFRGAKEPPYETKLSDGRHFVAISGQGRHEVVTSVVVRADRQSLLIVRPPLTGDEEARQQALAHYKKDDPAAIAALASSAGLRFVVVAELGRSNVVLRNFDGRSGAPLAGAEATLSANPSDPELDAAATQLTSAAMKVEPLMAEAPEEEGGWLWPYGVIGAIVVVAGAGVATAFLLSGDGRTLYSFER